MLELYSPENTEYTVSCDIFLFSKLKETLKKQRILAIDKIKTKS